jgi:uncharacterized protein DUF1569
VLKTLARPRDKAEILRRLESVRPDSARRFGRMSPHQMVCHLSDAFRMATGEKAVSPATSLLHRTLVKWIALYVPLPWMSGIVTRPEIDQDRGGTRPTDFAADVAQLATLVEMIAAAPPGTLEGVGHPVFGRMSAAAWLRWGYLHTDHHLRQFGA